MLYKTIDRYLTETLKPQLAVLDVQDALVQHTLGTVRTQMVSCIKHWNDERFRYALLTVGDEEAGFYKPKADYDIRSFVVVTVRNSALETIHTMTTANGWKGKVLSAEKIQEITSKAIESFKDADFAALSDDIGEIENDIYGELAARYPIAWEALVQIGESKNQIINYEAVKREDKPNLRNLRPQKANFINAKIEGDLARATEETSDGYALAISPELREGIQQRIHDRVPFIVDSFKGVSRNIEKLLTVMEYLMWNDNGLVTSNYLIWNGHIECRLELTKPGHSMADMIKNWNNQKGLAKNHQRWLQAAAEAAKGVF